MSEAMQGFQAALRGLAVTAKRMQGDAKSSDAARLWGEANAALDALQAKFNITSLGSRRSPAPESKPKPEPPVEQSAAVNEDELVDIPNDNPPIRPLFGRRKKS